jgi:16S rRNA (adenine1518-N6/adenine1519-N6)-dimethyltransferase
MPRPPRDRRPSPSRAPPRRDQRARFENVTQAQQHDLVQACADQLVRHARIAHDQPVIEIGPGTGAITAALLSAGARVQAIERDGQRVEALRRRFASELASGRLLLDQGDALAWRPPLAEGWRVVANPPFNLTAALLRQWLVEAPLPPVALDLVLQRDAADKLQGSMDVPDAHTRSSALIALTGMSRVAAQLKRGDVDPPSRVDLCVWILRRHDDAPPPAALALVDRLLAIAFAGPRTMAEALRGVASTIQLRRQGAEHGWNPADHPRAVPPRAWLPLAELLRMCGKI